MDENNVSEVKEKKHSKGTAIFVTFAIIFSLAAFFFAGVLLYQKWYLTPFWVNGQSMYPTLNKDAVRANGDSLGVNGGAADAGCKMIDYGVMDKHEPALRYLKRFNIVVCNYSFKDDSDKIKRIVGLPGETIAFGTGENNGQLYVKEGDSFTLVKQPIEDKYITAGTYPTGEIKLGNDEYYVLGDNRAHSSDSRNNGPIKQSYLIGKVVAICAHCEIKENSDHSLEPFNVSFFAPRYL